MVRLSKKNLMVSGFLIITLGSAVLWWVARSTDTAMRAELLHQARIAASAVSKNMIASLSASEKDLGKASYQRIKAQLSSMRKARRNCRFLYLMGMKPDGRVFFFVDSLSPGEEDYAPPGLAYDEVPASYLPAFKLKKEAVVGPVSDRWGTLITALVPVVSNDAENLLAVLGMDVNAQEWDREIIKRCIGPSMVILLLMVLLFILASREKILAELQNSQEKYRDIVENATNLFYFHTADHVLTYISPQCREYLQCEPEEAMIQWTEFATDNPINAAGFELTQKAIDTGNFQKPYQLELIGKKGKKILVEVNERPVSKDGVIIGVVGSLTDITDRNKAEKTLLQERDNLKKALAEIKVLRGILPICMICKKIRDDKGYWSRIEAYIENHSDTEFSHSICPECAEKHYPGMELYDDG